MDVERFFTPADHRTVEDAVREAEMRTSGEIVPFVVARSDDYREAPWAAALVAALLAASATAAVLEAAGLWLAAPALWAAAAAAMGGALGYAAATLADPVARLMVSRKAMDTAVERRARAAFVDHEVFATRERTGVLIFLSLFERRVVVLADAGINEKVRQDEWDGIVTRITAGIRAGRPGEALAEAIRACGTLLTRAGVARRADDRDELADGLRLEDR